MNLRRLFRLPLRLRTRWRNGRRAKPDRVWTVEHEPIVWPSASTHDLPDLWRLTDYRETAEANLRRKHR